jgi:carbon monoxide dehydrogenase subunit G
MIQFQGNKQFALPIAEVAAKMSDAAFLVHCLPDIEITEATPDKAAWKLKPRLSFLTGSLHIEMTATERNPGQAIAFKVFSKAMGATSTVLTRLKFEQSEGGGTVIHWTGIIEQVTGLLKAVPKGLMQGAAEKVIEDVWAAVAAKLGGPTPS